MSAIEYRIAPSIFEAHPHYCRGVLVVRDASNGPSSSALVALLRQEESDLRVRLSGMSVQEFPAIHAWRDAFRAFGAKPSEHRSSIEAMARRVIKPDQLPSINALVDIGNLVSLRHLLPAGVHPLPLSSALIELRHAKAGDSFLPADGSAAEVPSPAEIVFCQGQDVLTRRWTWRQAAGTQTLASTSSVYFNVDGLAPISAQTVQQAMSEIQDLVVQETGGRVILSTILDARQPALTLKPE